MRFKKFKKFEIYVNASNRTPEEIKERRCEICSNIYDNHSSNFNVRGVWKHCRLISHKHRETISLKGVCPYFGMTLEQARKEAGDR